MVKVMKLKFRFSNLLPLALAFVVCSPFTAAAADLGGLQIFSAVDIVGDVGLENAPIDSSRMKVRSFELATFGPVDPLFDAVINVAGHDEDGTLELELHEAYIGSDVLLSKFLQGTRFKAGRFLLGVGRLNQFHSHDWPFTSPPKSHEQFFAHEAAIDTGLEVTHLFSQASSTASEISSSTAFDITMGVTNGWTYGHDDTGGSRPLAATHYVRPSMYRDFGDNSGLLFALNYLGRTDSDSIKTQLTGFDVTFKQKAGRALTKLFQAEAYHRLQSSAYLPISEEVGGYVFFSHAVDDAGEYRLGLRADGFKNLSLTFASGDRKSNFDYALVPNLTYRASEFSTIRASYGYAVELREGEDPRVEQKIEIQLIALFGAHPAHDF